MFDLALSDEQSVVADVVHDLALRLVSPAAAQAETERAVPSALWPTLMETGMTAPVAEAYGGGGVPDALTHVIAAEGLAYGDPGIAMATLWGGAPSFWRADERASPCTVGRRSNQNWPE